MTIMTEARKQAVNGVVPPQIGEAVIRAAYPAITSHPAVATMGRKFIQSYFLAPLGWGMMLPFYFLKVIPFTAKRYMLTNRRLMIQTGPRLLPKEEVALADIDEVRVKTDDNSKFFLAATLEIVSNGQVKMLLPGMPEPESFKIAIQNACMAWVPGRAKEWLKFVPSKSPDGK